jgi:hypothetical protein
MEYSFNNKSIGNNIIYSENVQIFIELIINLIYDNYTLRGK